MDISLVAMKETNYKKKRSPIISKSIPEDWPGLIRLDSGHEDIRERII